MFEWSEGPGLGGTKAIADMDKLIASIEYYWLRGHLIIVHAGLIGIIQNLCQA